MKSGIVLLAINHYHYAKMAVNLAISIKLSNPEVHITLLHDDKILSELIDKELRIFDNFIEIPKELYIYDGKIEYGLVKVNIYFLTPYENTLYIDADSLMMDNKKIDYYFEKIESQSLLFISGRSQVIKDNINGSVSGWMPVAHVYNFAEDLRNKNILIDLQSSVFGYKKNKETDKIIESCVDFYYQLYKSPYRNTIWYNCIADELLFALALCKHDNPLEISRHKVAFIFERVKIKDIFANYNFISYASGTQSVSEKYVNLYNNMIGINASKYKLGTVPYFWKDKTLIFRKRK